MPNRSRLDKLRFLRRLRKSRHDAEVSAREQAAASAELTPENAATSLNEIASLDSKTALDKTAMPDANAAPSDHSASHENIASDAAASTRTNRRRRFVRLRKSRVVKWLAPLTVFALLAFWLTGVVRQRVDIDAIVRRSILPEVEKRVGAPVEVGRIESDLTHVTLTDVVIGRDAKLPTGALLRAKTIRLDADLLAIALRRVSDPLAALRAVTVTAPQLYLQRNERGVFNWAKVFQTPSQSTSTNWQGRVEIVDGRIYYLDETLRAAPQSRIANAPLRVDARGINGGADFSKDGEVAFSAALASARFPLYRQQIGALKISGESGTTPAATAENATRWLNTDAKFSALPAFVFTDYAFQGGQITTRAGRIAGNLQVAFDGAAPPTSRLLFAGDLTLSEIAGRTELVKLPGASALPFAALNGPLNFRGTAFSSSGIAVRALNTPLRLAGSFALPTAENPAPPRFASTRESTKSAPPTSRRATDFAASNSAETSPNKSLRDTKTGARDVKNILRDAAQNSTVISQSSPSKSASTRTLSRGAAEWSDAKNPAPDEATVQRNAAAQNAAARLKSASTRTLKNAARDLRKNRSADENRVVSAPQESLSAPTIFSVSASSNNVQMARIAPLLRAFPALRELQIEAAPGALQMQISGDTSAFATTAKLQLPSFALRDARYGTLRGNTLSATVNVNRNGRGALSLESKQATFGSEKTFGAVRAPRGFANILNASLNFGAGVSPAARFAVSGLRGQASATTSSAAFRAGDNLQLRASSAGGFAIFATDGTLRGGTLTTSEMRAASPRARVLATGLSAELAPLGAAANAKNYALNFNANRLETSGALLTNTRGGATKTSLQVRGVRVAATLGRENSASFSSERFATSGYGAGGFRAVGSALRGAVRQGANGYLSADFSAPALRFASGNAAVLPEALRNLNLNGAAWNGAVRTSEAPTDSSGAQSVFFASTRNADLRSARYGWLRAAALQLTFVQNGAAQRAALQLKSFAAKPAATWPEQARRALGSRALRGDSLRIDAASEGADAPWRGVMSLEKVDASALDFAVLSPQIANYASDLGTLFGRANFEVGARGGTIQNGEFSLSRVTVEGEKLRDVRGLVALQNGALQLRELRAQSDSGALSAQADYDFPSGALSLELDAPRLALDAARFNPYLAAQGVAIGGRAVGKVKIRRVGGARFDAPLRVEFDVTVPRGVVRNVASTRVLKTSNATGAPDALALKNLRLRGSGLWRGAARGWNFSGETEVFAQRAAVGKNVARLASLTLPNWIGGARLRNFHAKMRGEIAGVTGGKSAPLLVAKNGATTPLVPASPRDFPARAAVNKSASTRGTASMRTRLSGSVSVENVSASLPKSGAKTRAANLELSNARADFSLVGNELRVPRFAARVPQLAARAATFSTASQRDGEAFSAGVSTENAGRIGGSFLRRADGTLGGQIAVDAVDARAAQQLAAQFAPEFSMESAQLVRGAAFARLALSGTVAAPRARLQMQLLDAGVRTATAGVPIDLLRLQTTLPPRENGALALDEATLWSGGGRLSLSGELRRVREYSRGAETFALNLEARADGLPMARLAATPELEKLRRELEIDGLVSGEARVLGTLSQPRVEGRAALRLAQIAGVGVTEITSPFFYEVTARGAVLKLAALTARIEQASVSGAVTVDAPAGLWNADLKIGGAPTTRLLRAAADAADLLARRENGGIAKTSASDATSSDGWTGISKQLRALQDVPLRADLRAELSLRGTAGIAKVANANERVAALREYSHGENAAAKTAESSALRFTKIGFENRDHRNFLLKSRGANDAAQQSENAVSPIAAARRSQTSAELFQLQNETVSAGARAAKNAALIRVVASSNEIVSREYSRTGRAAATNAFFSEGALRENSSAKSEAQRRANSATRTAKNAALRLTARRETEKRRAQNNAETGAREYSQEDLRAAWWPSLTLESASLKLASDDVKWRGRTLGELRGTLSLQGEIARTDFILLRQKTLSPSARQYAPAPFLDAAFVENLASQNDGEKRDVILSVRGEVPLRGGENFRAAPLDVTARIEDEKFSLVRDALLETQNALRERGFQFANFDAALLRLRALPREMQANVSAQARLSGTLENPALAVDAVADNARRGDQVLPSLQAALNFDDSAIGVRGLELRQPYEDKAREYSRLVSGAAPSVSSSEKAASDAAPLRTTVVRLAEGGRIAPTGDIELDGEILNANLSQLAAWIPELRKTDGAPLLRGEVSLFSFQVRGTMQEPRVAGSIEARDLLYRAYTLDRLRVSRFDIEGGRFSIEPGNLTVVKGKFQSSAPWGYLPWTWGDENSAPGPRRDALLEVHFPLQSRDFGALAGTFVPALQNAAADEFSGTVTLTGSFDAPQFSGEATLGNARFRADPALVPVAFGMEGLSGKVRFENGNRLEIDDLRGRLVEADAVRAAATNNLPAAERDARAARRAARRPEGEAPPHLAGAFSLNGNVQLDLDGRNFEAPGQSLSAHRYDLKLSLQNGEYSTAQFSGLKNIALDLVLQTAAGAPRTSQNLFWTLNANGDSSNGKRRKAKTNTTRDGLLVSSASVVLAPDFASGANAFFRSRFRGRVLMRALPFAVKDVAMGRLDGLLQLDNETPSAGRRPFELPPTLADLRRELQAPRAAKTSAQISAPLSLTTRASGLQQPLAASPVSSQNAASSQYDALSPKDAAPLPIAPRDAPASTRRAPKVIADDPRRLARRSASSNAPAMFSTQRDNARAGSRNGIEARADEAVTNRAALSDDARESQNSGTKNGDEKAGAIANDAKNAAKFEANDAGKVAQTQTPIRGAIGNGDRVATKNDAAKNASDAIGATEKGATSTVAVTKSRSEKSSLSSSSEKRATISPSGARGMTARETQSETQPSAAKSSQPSTRATDAAEIATSAVSKSAPSAAPQGQSLYSQSRPGAKTIGEQLAPREIAPPPAAETAREYSQAAAIKADASNSNVIDANATNLNADKVRRENAESDALESGASKNEKVVVEKVSSQLAAPTTAIIATQQIAKSVAAHQAQSREYSRALQEKLAQETATSPLKVAPANELRALQEEDFGAPLRVSGQVEMSQTEISGAPIGTAGVGGVLPDAPRFDFALLVGRDVRFLTPTLRAQFTGTLDIGGTPHDPYIVGTLSARDGQIRFPNATARLTEGEVSVNITRDPVADAIRSRVEIDAAATGRVGSYNITLALRGPLDFGSENEQNLRVDVSSDPPLAKDEAFALLTGTSLRELESGNGSVRAEDANRVYARAVVSLLASPLFAGIERTLEEALGLSSITLDYRFEEPLSVQFGKAVGDRIYVTYRRSVGPAFDGARTPYALRIEYRIKGGLQLGVQTDETGRNQLTLNKTFRF